MVITYKEYKNGDDVSNIDVLFRVYNNQQFGCSEKEQVVGEVLFKPHLEREHERFTAWLPRGIANAFCQLIKSIEKEFDGCDIRMQISNELPEVIGVLTSCRDNFDNSMKCNFDHLSTEGNKNKEK